MGAEPGSPKWMLVVEDIHAAVEAYRALGFLHAPGAAPPGEEPTYGYLIYPHKPIVSYDLDTGELLGEHCVGFPDREDREHGGRLLVPSFAVGRAQELIYEINRLIQSGEIPPLPVYVDSPLATNVSEVFAQHEELYDEETLAFMRASRTKVFAFSSLNYTRSVEESKAINEMKGPLVVISASGMAESGRILHHLRNNIEDPRNTILIVSWQAANTLGRRLAERAPEVRIFGDLYQVRAQVATINGYSGHAGRDLLIRWATALKPRDARPDRGIPAFVSKRQEKRDR